MEPVANFENDKLFPDRQPWDVVYDALWVTHGEFWLVAGSGPGGDIDSAIPEDGSIKGNGEAVGIPAASANGRVGAALSVWEEPAPDSQGTPLGTCRIGAPDRELALVNVEGRESGPVLVLPDAGEYQVSVWRCAAAGDGGSERYDIRVWPCPTPR
ncbi:hypothetical protein ACGFYZ_33830 [Streptomyces sp. NPDC048330]|uniref:hypothetical protein n=1 Tax=Streptomyces sp. NPDC048330 TaxID=3365533 RepID=UPI0037229A49